MFENNIRFRKFELDLADRGVTISYAWEARREGSKPRWPSKPADICMLLFTGNGFQPSVLNAVAIDYGPASGFGLFIDSGKWMAEDVERIAKPREPVIAYT